MKNNSKPLSEGSTKSQTKPKKNTKAPLSPPAPAKKVADFENKLSKKLLFAKSFEPFDYSKNMGQLAVEIKWTDGDTDVLTTPMDPNRGSDRGNFKDEAEYYEFIEWLISKGVRRA